MPTAVLDAIAPRIAVYKHLVGSFAIRGPGQTGNYIDPAENSYDGPSCWLGRAAPKPTDPPGTYYTYWQPIWTFDLTSIPLTAQITGCYHEIWVDSGADVGQNYDPDNRSRHAAIFESGALQLTNPPVIWMAPDVPGSPPGAYFAWAFQDINRGWKRFNSIPYSYPNAGFKYIGQVDRESFRVGKTTLYLVETDEVSATGVTQAYRRIGNDYAGYRPRIGITYTLPDPLGVDAHYYMDGKLYVLYTTTQSTPRLEQRIDTTLQGQLNAYIAALVIQQRFVESVLEAQLFVIGTNLTITHRQADVTMEGQLGVLFGLMQAGGAIQYPIASPSILEFNIYGDGITTYEVYETIEVGTEITATATHVGFGTGGTMEVGVEIADTAVLHAYSELYLTGNVRGDLRYNVVVRGR